MAAGWARPAARSGRLALPFSQAMQGRFKTSVGGFCLAMFVAAFVAPAPILASQAVEPTTASTPAIADQDACFDL